MSLLTIKCRTSIATVDGNGRVNLSKFNHPHLVPIKHNHIVYIESSRRVNHLLFYWAKLTIFVSHTCIQARMNIVVNPAYEGNIRAHYAFLQRTSILGSLIQTYFFGVAGDGNFVMKEV